MYLNLEGNPNTELLYVLTVCLCVCMWVHGCTQSFFAERFFALFDSDGSSTISLDELLKALDLLIHGSETDKLKFLFQVYDVDGQGAHANKHTVTDTHTLALRQEVVGYVEMLPMLIQNKCKNCSTLPRSTVQTHCVLLYLLLMVSNYIGVTQNKILIRIIYPLALWVTLLQATRGQCSLAM